MAVSGGACTAYRCRLKWTKLEVQPTTHMRRCCAAPADALSGLLAGERVTVAGSDMSELRGLLDGVRWPARVRLGEFVSRVVCECEVS